MIQPNKKPVVVRMSKAAYILQTLGVCKAFGPSGRINGPNCQRFGHRDPSSQRWHWDVAELIAIARERGCASPEAIQDIHNRFLDPERVPTPPPQNREHNRAIEEKRFRDSVRELEAVLRKRLPQALGGDRRTLGDLIHDARQTQRFSEARLAELNFVNKTRNAMNHPGNDEVPDEDLVRATDSARALVRSLQ